MKSKHIIVRSSPLLTSRTFSSSQAETLGYSCKEESACSPDGLDWGVREREESKITPRSLA